ncbi:hypothetical protein [Methylobacterium sp. Leaf118]|uniref:hypothetical protein n=1 Tax=Methylobacterium sp. Leaf118 TaxID=2876562 RepID=UPI001E4DB36A|nr:hypothetical protein [Methylobacterium sp. Leaf118]
MPAAAVAAPPAGAGCGPTIEQMQTIVEGDVRTGDLSEAVGKRFGADLDKASAACAAGRGAEALRLLAAAKSRYGYR